MTSVYPSQSTPSFLQKYTKHVFHRVHYDAHHEPHQNMDEAAISLQVRNQFEFYGSDLSERKELFNQ